MSEYGKKIAVCIGVQCYCRKTCICKWVCAV